MTRFFFSVLVVYVLATPAHPQSVMERAISAGNAVEGPEALMNEEVIDDYVLHYETSTPPEGGMSHVQFEEEISNVRNQDDVQGRVLRATEDGFAVRPGVDIDGQGVLFDDANWAHENAEDVAGKYFSSETGTCETVALPTTSFTDQFCSSSPASETRTCDLVRKITVDRTDLYQCDKRAATYVEVCEKTTEYACYQGSGQNGCVQQNVQFSGGTVTWNGSQATLSIPAPSSGPDFIARHAFSLSVSDHFAADEVRLIHIEAGGVSQLTKVPDSGIGIEVLETFYTGSGNGIGAGNTCPATETDGLVVPTYFYGTGSECNRFPPTYQIGIFQDLLLQNADVDLRSFVTRHTVSTSGEHGFACQPRSVPPSCASFQDFATSSNFTRNLLRWMDVPAPTLPVPGMPKKWMETEFTMRVVAPRANQHVALTFEFIGSCCDNFIDVGGEVCQ